MIQNKEYPKNTLGFHRQFAEKVFGEGSAPVLWLDEEAEKVEAGYDEPSNQTEEQVILHLKKLHDQEMKDEAEGYVDEDLEEG